MVGPEVERNRRTSSLGSSVKDSVQIRPSSQLSVHWARRLRLSLRRLTLAQQFGLAASLVLGLTMIMVGSWINGRITDGVLRSSAEVGGLFMASLLEPYVQELENERTLPPASIAKLDEVVANFASRRHVLSVKIWLRDGTVAYSIRRALIGQKFPTEDIQPALRGEIKGYLNALDEEENAYERTLSVPLYEIYAPLYKTGTKKIIAVGEFYENAQWLHEELYWSSIDNWLVVGGLSIGMLTILFMIVNRGSRLIARQERALRERLEEQANLHRTNEQLRARMENAMRESVRIDELIYRRIGAELHDGPAQLMAFVLLRLEDVEPALEGAAVSKHANTVEEIRSAASDALRDLRHIASGLFLPHLEENDDLLRVVRSIVEAHERRTGSSVVLEAAELPDNLPRGIIRCVGRVTQEALTNAYKHAGGIGQKVHISVRNNEIVLSISDRGPGIADASQEGTHLHTDRLGVPGMRYRVESIGGSLELISQPMKGTEVVCRIPLQLKGQIPK